MHRYITSLLLLSAAFLHGQASFTAIGTPYTQNFNTLPNATDGSDLATWTNNGTLPGWYIEENATGGASCNASSCNDRPTIEASYTSINNGGNAYIYASGADRSLGSRAAGSTATVCYGVRVLNNTGTTINSVYVDYYGEQWSIAENGANVNSIAFAYQVGATSLNTGTWTNVGALDFNQLWTSSQSAGLGGSACGGSSSQCLALDGNLSANRTRIQGCIPVTIAAGEEIWFRWTDIDNGANDHHMQIDDVSIYPYDVTCAVVLPVEWFSFTAERDGNTVVLHWETASEENNDYFAVERVDESGRFVTIAAVAGSGTSSQSNQYTFTDESPSEGTNYYRLRQVDFNGQSSLSEIRTVFFSDDPAFTADTYYDGILHFSQAGHESPTNITLYSDDGKIISSLSSAESNGTIGGSLSNGMYFVRFENTRGTVVRKIVIVN